MIRSFLQAPGWFQRIAVVLMIGLLGMTIQLVYQHSKDTALGWEGRVDTLEKSNVRQDERLSLTEQSLLSIARSQAKVEERVETIYQILLKRR